MSSTVTTKLTWNKRNISLINDRAVKGLFRMGYDIAKYARMNAPYQTGALRNSIRVQEVDDTTLEVIAGGTFGGKKINYAMIRERGPNRIPGTEHYMENAQKLVMSGDYMTKYFGDITQ